MAMSLTAIMLETIRLVTKTAVIKGSQRYRGIAKPQKKRMPKMR
jgi:hypothetical protein